MPSLKEILTGWLLLSIWGISFLPLFKYAPKLGIGRMMQALISGLGFYIAWALTFIITETGFKWQFYLLWFVIMMPIGFGAYLLAAMIINILIKYRDDNDLSKMNTSESKLNPTTLRRIVLFIALLLISAIVAINTPISLIADKFASLTENVSAIALTISLCALISVFSLLFAFIMLLHNRILRMKEPNFAARVFISIMLGASPAAYGMLVFLVTGNTIAGIAFDFVALIAVILLYILSGKGHTETAS